MAYDGEAGLRTFFESRPALVITDILMPKLNGWDLLHRIRQVSEVPTIVLTALGDEIDTIRGLQIGADGYLGKPVRRGELAARVTALLRRSKGGALEVADSFEDGHLRIDFSRHEVHLKGNQIQLSPLEFRLLAALVRRPGVVLSAEQLLNLCWGDGAGGEENLRLYIGYLRKKLNDDAKQPRLIQTVREFGYRYVRELA